MELETLMETAFRILVTGANGHVGFNLVRTLFEDGYTKLRDAMAEPKGVNQHGRSIRRA